MGIEQLKESTKKLKVLFVEDSLSARKITQRMLSDFFVFIDVAADGKIAFDMYQDFYDKNSAFYDIVFTDLEMPNMDGKELSQHILDINPFQEIVVLSSVNDFKSIVKLINIGVKKFIAKPVEMDELVEIIIQVNANIRMKELKEKERLEVVEYNEYLQHKQEEHKATLEAKVKELEEFTHALDVSAIVQKTDPQGRITYVNDQFCKVSGYSAEELIGANNNILKSGNRSSSYYQKLWKTITDKKTYKNLFENKRKDGTLFYVETTISPLLDVHGEIIEFIGVSHDMTQLIKSNEATKSAQKSKENFFINISHEMKTPLNAILGFSSLLQKRLQDDEKSLMMVNTIAQTGNDLSNLINSIIDMRKIQERTLTLQEVNFNPQKEFKECFEHFRTNSEDKNQTYTVLLDRSIPQSLVGDMPRIKQVFGIIISNAIKFTPENGKVQVSVIYDPFSNLLTCDVKDNGIGISKENQKKIFAMEQLDAETNRAYEGAGLGLNIALNIVQIMKGKIILKSIPQKGSIFRIELPIHN
jgi:PAS domain S-box-containing protein